MSFDLYVDIPKCLANFKPFRIHLKMLDFFLHKKENVKRKNKTKILPTEKVLLSLGCSTEKSRIMFEDPNLILQVRISRYNRTHLKLFKCLSTILTADRICIYWTQVRRYTV